MLLVEDSTTDALFLRRILQTEPGMCLRHVTRLRDAVELLREQRFDTIISDISLPDGRGTDAVRRLRACAQDATLILCSGVADEVMALQGIALGAQEVVSKDKLDADTLLRTLRFARTRRQSELQMARLAFYDALTGLPNRAELHNRMGPALARARRNGSEVAVLLADLDGFKLINDRLGHEAGDEVLRSVATRLQAMVRDHDTVARLGGDEFVILLTDIGRHAPIEAITDRLLRGLSQPIRIEGEDVRVGASLGIAMFPAAGESATALLRAADQAMYAAKRAGKNRWHMQTTRAAC